MKKLMNEKTNFVADMLKGIEVMDNSVEIISGNVVVRKNVKKSGVALVSGGGSVMNLHMLDMLLKVC